MKKAFTMVELIFVIVILGILSSLAIPKVIATSNDAKVTTALTNLKILKDDLTLYYSKNNSLPTNTIKIENFTNATNVKWKNQNTISYFFPKNEECINIVLDPSNSSLTYEPTSNSNVLCQNLMFGASNSNLLEIENTTFKPKVDYLRSGSIYNIDNIK